MESKVESKVFEQFSESINDDEEERIEERNTNDHHLLAGELNSGWAIEMERKVSKPSFFRDSFHNIKMATCGWFRKELIAQLKLCFPIILTWLFQNLLSFVSLVFVGHISGKALELDSVALATSFTNVTGISVGIGLSSAADTLCSQTYGSKNYKRVGHILQQGILILLIVCLFVWGTWLNTDNLLLVLQQPPCVSRYAGYYTKIFGFCLPAFFVYVMMQKYLQSQSRVWPFIIVGIITNILNVVLHSILLLVLDLGIIGAAISMAISNISQPIFLIIYIKISKIHKQTWGGWSWHSLNDWWLFLKLGIPGMAMICLEWVSYEIAVFVLGSIGEVELAINSILINALVLMFMIPLGISISSGIRVGNALGAGNPKGAKRAAYMSLLLVVITSVLQLILLQSIKNVVGSIYTKEEAVLKRLPLVINIITPGLFFDQVQLVIQGILRGCGLQTMGALINFGAFYFFGLPLGISLAFLAEMGVIGVWLGLMSATTTQCVIYMIIVLKLNWKKQSQKAQKRAGQNESKDEDTKKEEDNIPLSIMKNEEYS